MIEQLENDPWFQALSAIQFYASLAALIFLAARWRRQGALLPFEPRRPAPWGAVAALPALAFTAMIILAVVVPAEARENSVKPGSRDQILNLAASIVVQSLGPIFLLCIAAASKANWSDIGLPVRSVSSWGRDAAIGVVACLAAILPVALVLNAVNWLLGIPNQLTKHQLVEMIVEGGPQVAVLTLATVTTVIVAPIAEEIIFRLMLQSWLEKWEDRSLGWRTSPAADATNVQDTPPEFANQVHGESESSASLPPKRGIGGLPYGWTPIIVSSFVFAAAHIGYGPEPAPLFVLALVLGYCYQRTHRIVPSIVAHGLFNLFSMLALWRLVYLQAG